jgi:hypothetical protein
VRYSHGPLANARTCRRKLQTDYPFFCYVAIATCAWSSANLKGIPNRGHVTSGPGDWGIVDFLSRQLINELSFCSCSCDQHCMQPQDGLADARACSSGIQALTLQIVSASAASLRTITQQFGHSAAFRHFRPPQLEVRRAAEAVATLQFCPCTRSQGRRGCRHAHVCDYHRPSWNGSTKTAMHSKFCPEQEV